MGLNFDGVYRSLVVGRGPVLAVKKVAMVTKHGPEEPPHVWGNAASGYHIMGSSMLLYIVE